MNFLILLTKFKIFFLFVLILVSSLVTDLFAEICLNDTKDFSDFISPTNKSTTSVYFTLANGHLILGQKDRISIFNGNKWDHIPVNGKILLCSNKANTIFYSGEKEIGYLSTDSSGNFISVRVDEKLPPKYRNLYSNQIINIASVGSTFFFQTPKALLSFRDGKFTILDEDIKSGKIYSTDENLISQTNNGLIKVYSEDLKNIVYSTGFLDICRVIRITGGYFIFGADNFLYKTDLSFVIQSKTLMPLDQFIYPVNPFLVTPKKVPFFHKIKKEDNIHWFNSASSPYISLRNLDEGNYLLKLKKKAGTNSVQDTALVLKTLPPFYFSWMAYLLYSLILLIILFVLYKTFSLKLSRPKSVIEIKSEEITSEAIPSDSGRLPESVKKDRWDKFEMVTVLFSDIQGFSKIAESMNPEVLIDELDKFFFHFDSVVEKYNIEKIKTIGDAYMAAGGIPQVNVCNPVEVVLAALEMQQFMKDLKNSRAEIWDLRIGIHSGPVIAGVIGFKKRSYDIWGDTVNTASRMESSGEPGKVNISGVTYDLVKDFFVCEYRGRLPVKYKGNIDMYFVKGIRPNFSSKNDGVPNRKFFIKLQTLRLQDVEKAVFQKFETDLPENNYFHNIEFARHQYEYARLIVKSEQLDAEESLLVLTASLLMNTGYSMTPENHEIKSAEFARTLLPEFQYSEKQITIISNLILSIKVPSDSQTLTEKLLNDISMEYLGRKDFLSQYRLLFRELKLKGAAVTVKEFKKQQIKILMDHNYFTSTAKRLQEVPRDDQIKRIHDDEWSEDEESDGV